MFSLRIRKEIESWDSEKQEFLYDEELIAVVELEHSLATLSKWERKWKVPFLTTDKTPEQKYDYLVMMLKNPEDEKFLEHLSDKNAVEIDEFMQDSQTAAWFNEHGSKGKPNNEVVTAEIMYYWMFTWQIPLELEHWHLNRLIVLLRTFDLKQRPPEKMSPEEAAAERKRINKLRQQEYGYGGE